MRPKFIFALLLLALLVLGAAFFLKQHLGNTATPPPVTESATPAPVANVAPPPAPAPVAATPVVTNAPTPEQHQAAIEAEADRLQQWSMNDDPASLSNILADLTNPEKEIREAAIEATKQFGSTNAIPALKATASNTDDPEEKIALLDAADFLSLPSITSIQLPPLTPEQAQANQQKKIDRQNRLHPNRPSNSQSTAGQGQSPAPNQ